MEKEGRWGGRETDGERDGQQTRIGVGQDIDGYSVDNRRGVETNELER